MPLAPRLATARHTENPIHSKPGHSLPHLILGCLGLAAALALSTASAHAPPPAIDAYAVFEIVASGLHEPTGLAADPVTGDLFIAEADTGLILRLDPQGRLHTHATGFHRPLGLAWAASSDGAPGTLLVVDEQAGSLSRITLTGAVTRLRNDLKKPHWVSVAEDGTIYLTAEGGAGFTLRGHDEGILVQLASDGSQPQLLAKGLKRPAGLRILSDESVRFLADRLQSEGERDGGTVFELSPDGTLEILVRSGFKQPNDLSLDVLDATYLTARMQREDREHPEKGVIGKAFSEDGVALFATGLKEPHGILLDTRGNLYVAERDAGRLIKFIAPQPPALDPSPPAFTRETTLTITGTAEPSSLLTIRGASVPLLGQQDVSARVAIKLSGLVWNHRTGIGIQRMTLTNIGATPLAGPLAIVLANLTPPEVTLTNATSTVNGHPAIQVPLLDGLLRPGERIHTVLRFASPQRGRVSFTSSVWAIQPLAVSDAEGHFSFPVTFTPNTENHLEIFATAALGLGLTSAATKATVMHDDTPPEVTITGGPAGEIGVSEATFAFTAHDNVTPADALQFAWALDAAPFTAFQPVTSAKFIALSAGPHTFRVKARDQAGNESSTPATRSFSVRSLWVTITQPGEGATVPAGLLLVRGTVEAGGVEVGVAVNGIPAAIQGTVFAASVPVTPDTTSLTAVATTSSGATASSGVNVRVLPAPPPPLALEAFPPGGAPPLTVTFHLLNNTGRSLVQFELDYDGNGTIDFSSPTFDEPKTRYTSQGFVFPVLRATDDQGQVYTATTLVTVGGTPALAAKWDGMKDALRRGDIPAALTFIHSGARERYAAVFRRLTPSQLATIDQYLTTIVPVEIGHNGAEYEMRRTRGNDTLSFPVWFQVDTDGIWRLHMF